MRIAFLLGGLYSGGIARVTSILANSLCDCPEFDVHIISYVSNSQKEAYPLKGHIHKHALFSTPISMKKAILAKGAIGKIRQILVTNHIDILICCDAIFFPLGILSCRSNRVKCYCWEHTSPYIQSDHKFQQFCRTFGIKHCDKFITLTKDAEAYYKKRFPRYSQKVVQIYNPVDEDCKQSEKYDCRSTKIMAVGRLVPVKNYERLIRIASVVLPLFPEWSLDIYGDGELADSLRQQIVESKAHNQIFLRGQTPDIYSLYGKYSFLVMTSKYEGFPMTLIEAAANRLPLICFDIKTGPNEIICHGINGYLIDETSDNEMIKSIISLIEDPDLRNRMSQNAFKTADRFAIKNVLNEWTSILADQEIDA